VVLGGVHNLAFQRNDTSTCHIIMKKRGRGGVTSTLIQKGRKKKGERGNREMPLSHFYSGEGGEKREKERRGTLSKPARFRINRRKGEGGKPRGTAWKMTPHPSLVKEKRREKGKKNLVTDAGGGASFKAPQNLPKRPRAKFVAPGGGKRGLVP